MKCTNNLAYMSNILSVHAAVCVYLQYKIVYAIQYVQSDVNLMPRATADFGKTYRNKF